MPEPPANRQPGSPGTAARCRQYKVGQTYTWSDGTTGTYNGGQGKPDNRWIRASGQFTQRGSEMAGPVFGGDKPPWKTVQSPVGSPAPREGGAVPPWKQPPAEAPLGSPLGGDLAATAANTVFQGARTAYEGLAGMGGDVYNMETALADYLGRKFGWSPETMQSIEEAKGRNRADLSGYQPGTSGFVGPTPPPEISWMRSSAPGSASPLTRRRTSSARLSPDHRHRWAARSASRWATSRPGASSAVSTARRGRGCWRVRLSAHRSSHTPRPDQHTPV